MKLTLEENDRTVIIIGDGESIVTMWEHMLRPALLAWGFEKETVDGLVKCEACDSA